MWNSENKEIGNYLSSNYYKEQEEAYNLIELYGKSESTKKCKSLIFGYNKEIEDLLFYDKEKISTLITKMHFFYIVGVLCKNWIENDTVLLFDNFGYKTDEVCCICKAKKTRSEPRYNYSVCIEHFKLTLKEINSHNEKLL